MVVYHDHLQETIHHRLSVFGVPTYMISPFAGLVTKWVRCSGVEWTVKRLKSLKVDLLKTRSGLPTSTWCQKNRKGNFSGVIGSLFRWASKSEQNFQSAIHSLMVYSVFAHKSLSEAQKQKFVNAVTAKTNTIDSSFYDDFSNFIKNKHQGSRMVPRSNPRSLLEWRGSPSKKAPIFERSSVSQEHAGLISATYFDQSPYHYALYRKYESLYKPVMAGINTCNFDELFRQSRFAASCPWTEGIWGGEVHFLQEPGLKLRSIASPYLVHQAALEPLKNTLARILQTFPWDCTTDHAKPVSVLQTHLRAGKTVHSVDLTSATDFFPLEVQLTALQAVVGNHPSIDLFAEISRSQWKSSIGTVQWSQGQPLGLGPSFFAFALTHGLLLSFLNGGRHDDAFYVLGDDVVILDDELHRKYRHYMTLLGCPISEDKSLSSNSLCEFGGKVIATRRVFPSYKWREVSNDNFIDLVRNYGRKAVSLLSGPQRSVVEKVQHLLPPFGLNWSYPGSSLESMSSLTVSTLGSPRVWAEQSMTRLFRTVVSNYYKCPSNRLRSVFDTEVASDLISAFDEKAAAVFAEIYPSDWAYAIERLSLRSAFSGVPRVLGNSDLPPETLEPSRVTTLDMYKKLLYT